MEELGFWNFIHGTGAGCASIAAWEAAHTFLAGPVAIIVFGALTGVIVHAVRRHRHHMLRQVRTLPPRL